MILRGRKFPFLLFTLLVVVAVATGWAVYHRHLERYANNSATPALVPPTYRFSDVGRTTTSASHMPASTFPSRTKPTIHAPTVPDHLITTIDQDLVEVDNDIHDMVREAIHHDFPELNLSESELLDLSGTIVLLRDALAKLRNTVRNAENFRTIQQLEDIRDNAIGDFEQITGMNLNEFLYRLPADGGIDNEKSDDTDLLLEPLSDYQP